MTRMTVPDRAVRLNLVKTNTHIEVTAATAIMDVSLLRRDQYSQPGIVGPARGPTGLNGNLQFRPGSSEVTS